MCSKKISIWHVIYLILLTVVVNVFLLAICPGRVSEAAMDNISFASAIVSIVLALVSIVYSLQSGFSSSSQLDSIKNIEGNIHAELKNFQKLRDTIFEMINPIESVVGNLQKSTGDIQKAQDSINKNVDGLNKTVSLTVLDSKGENKEKNITLTHTMVVSLYAAIRSKETGMDLPFHVFANFIGGRSYYVEGMLEILNALGDGITMTVGSSSTRKKIIDFDQNKFGTKAELKKKAEENPIKKIGYEFIAAIDDYYSDMKNQQPKDSVG